MKLYVDGNDLVSAIGRFVPGAVAAGDRRRTRGNVASWLARYAQQQRCDVELVFDEGDVTEVLPPTERHGAVRVTNLKPGASALQQIAGPANRAAREERVLVVTDDPRLADAMQRGGVRAMNAEEFLRSARRRVRGDDAEGLDEPDEKFTGLSDGDVAFWVDQFRDEKRGEP